MQKGESILIQKVSRDSEHVDRVPDAFELAFGFLQRNEQGSEIFHSLWKLNDQFKVVY